MSQGKRVGAMASLLLAALVAQAPRVASAADGALRGPVVAIEKARAAANAESERSGRLDAAAAAAVGPAAVEAPAPAGDANEKRAGSEGVSGDRAGEVRGAATAPAAVGAPAAAVETEAAGGTETAPAGSGDAGGQVSSSSAQYDPSQHRDPFRPPNLTSSVADSGPRTPLEGYEIGQLKLVGIVSDPTKARAMVEDSAGLGYIVTAGTPIGSSGGVVRSIESRRVLIEETTTNFYGEKQPKEVVMELPQEDRSP